MVARADRRVSDAEAGARQIRERAAADLEHLQRSTYAQTADLRDEAVRLLAEARTSADAIRAEAQQALQQARAEVAALARRRDDIQTQLGSLAGVIEALAVPEPARTIDPDPAPIHPSQPIRGDVHV